MHKCAFCEESAILKCSCGSQLCKSHSKEPRPCCSERNKKMELYEKMDSILEEMKTKTVQETEATKQLEEILKSKIEMANEKIAILNESINRTNRQYDVYVIEQQKANEMVVLFNSRMADLSKTIAQYNDMIQRFAEWSKYIERPKRGV